MSPRRSRRRAAFAVLAVLVAVAVLVWLAMTGTPRADDARGAPHDAQTPKQSTAPPGESRGKPGPRPRARAGQPAADPSSANAASGPAERTLRIVDEAGYGVPGMFVGWGAVPDEKTYPQDWALTSLTGCATSPGAALAWFRDRTGLRTVELTSGMTEVVALGLPTLRISVVNGVTGAPFAATVVVPRRAPRGLQADIAAVPDGADQIVPSYPLDSGPTVRAVPVVNVPGGYVAVPETLDLLRLPEGVRTVCMSVHVYREADVRLSVSDASGAAAAPEIDRIEPARPIRDFDFDGLARTAALAETTVPGTWRVTRLPAMPRLRVRVWVSGTAVETDDGVVGGGSGATRWLDLDRGGASVLSLAIGEPGLHGTTGNTTSGIGGRVGRPYRVEGAHQRVRVRLLHPDGSPVAGAWVTSGVDEARTDDCGDATVLAAPGWARITARSDTILPTTQEIGVPFDGVFVLRSPRGRTVEIRVVDGGDQGIGLARVTVETVTILDSGGEVIPWRAEIPRIEGDTLWTSIRTDLSGRAVLDRVPAGMLRVTASRGTSLGVTESDAAVVRVVAVQAR